MPPNYQLKTQHIYAVQFDGSLGSVEKMISYMHLSPMFVPQGEDHLLRRSAEFDNVSHSVVEKAPAYIALAYDGKWQRIDNGQWVVLTSLDDTIFYVFNDNEFLDKYEGLKEI